jgi:hypothetical protein
MQRLVTMEMRMKWQVHVSCWCGGALTMALAMASLVMASTGSRRQLSTFFLRAVCVDAREYA